MREIEALLGIDDLMRIFGLSQVSIYRKVREARAGNGQFPLPVWGSRKKLRWNAAEVEAFCQSRTTPQVPVKTGKQRREAKALRARNMSAQQTLADRHGIFVNSGKDE